MNSMFSKLTVELLVIVKYGETVKGKDMEKQAGVLSKSEVGWL